MWAGEEVAFFFRFHRRRIESKMKARGEQPMFTAKDRIAQSIKTVEIFLRNIFWRYWQKLPARRTLFHNYYFSRIFVTAVLSEFFVGASGRVSLQNYEFFCTVLFSTFCLGQSIEPAHFIVQFSSVQIARMISKGSYILVHTCVTSDLDTRTPYSWIRWGFIIALTRNVAYFLVQMRTCERVWYSVS